LSPAAHRSALRRKGIPSGVQELLDLSSGPIFLPVLASSVKMEMLIAKLAAAVGGDGNLSIGDMPSRRDVLIGPYS